MIAGTIARLESSVDDPVESFYNETHNRLPAFYVKATQTGLGEHRPIQQGVAADTVEVKARSPTPVVEDGTLKALFVEREPRGEKVVTDWVADVTGTGLIAAQSVRGSDRFAFPFDLFTKQTGERVELLEIDVPNAFSAWADEGALRSVWMAGSSDDSEENASTSIQYHDAASAGEEPTFGLGFTVEWSSSVARGVAYESGYVAVFNDSITASKFVRFVAERILPFTRVKEDAEEEFLDCSRSSDSEDFADEVEEFLEEEGIDADRDVDVDLTEFEDPEAEAEAILNDLDEALDVDRDEDGQVVCGEDGCGNTKAVAITDQGPLCYICLDGKRDDGEDVEVLERDVNENLGGDGDV